MVSGRAGSSSARSSCRVTRGCRFSYAPPKRRHAAATRPAARRRSACRCSGSLGLGQVGYGIKGICHIAAAPGTDWGLNECCLCEGYDGRRSGDNYLLHKAAISYDASGGALQCVHSIQALGTGFA